MRSSCTVLFRRQVLGSLLGILILTAGCLSIPILSRAQRSPGTVAYAAGSGPQGIASADVNADGFVDLLIANASANAVSILLNEAAQPGKFATPLTFPTKGTYPVALAVGDLNGDKYPDVVLVNETSSNVSVLLNTAGSTLFAPAALYTSGLILPRGVALGDVNHDGLLDIVLTATVSDKIGILLNSPTKPGTFQRAITYRSGGNRPEGIALGDVNGDGQLDIIVCNQASSSVGILLNSTKTPGKFANPVTYASGGSLPRSLTLGDINGDGRVDIIVSNSAAGIVSVLANSITAPGSFLPAVGYASAATGPIGIGAGDVTGDKAVDVVVADYNAKTGTTICLLRHSSTNSGSFSFTSPTSIYGSGGTGPHDIILSDLNGDGRLDIATTNFGSNTVGVLLNTGKF